MLLDTGMFDADLKDIYGAKLLALAASAGNEVIVQVLLDTSNRGLLIIQR